MRIRWTAILLIGWCALAQAQPYFPIKVNKKWGLINADGQVVLQPNYDAIGEFKRFGYAVMQRLGGVGLLDAKGKEIIAPWYDDLKVLDSTLIAVMHDGDWSVMNLRGDIVLPRGYERVNVLNGQYISYRRAEKWGIVDHLGKVISEPRYDEVTLAQNNLFLVRRGGKLGLLSASGKETLQSIADEVSFFNDSLIFYKIGSAWGAVDETGFNLIPAKYDAYSRISDTFIKLISNNRTFVYSLACNSIITQGDYDDYYAFSRKYLIVKKSRQLGLLDWCGSAVLKPQYFEIQSYEKDLFRVNYRGKWGLVQANDKFITKFEYDYMAPLRGSVGVVKKGALFGVVNFKGEEVVDARYQRIEIEDNRVKAYTRKPGSTEESLSVLDFDDEGKLLGSGNFDKHFNIRIGGRPEGKTGRKSDPSDYLLDDFEWFYSPVNDRWGLRRLADGSIQIEPTFSFVNVVKNLGFTLVGIEQSNRHEFERTTFRFDRVYGLVKNDIGLLVTDLEFWDVRFEDFYAGQPVARCVLSNGRHGLLTRIGKVIRKDFAYIGTFRNGVARMSVKGKLSGSMKEPNTLGSLSTYLNGLQTLSSMVDYTQYDQLFQKDAFLTCEGCEWGYVDSTGRVVAEPQYSFAQDFVNGVGMVECNGKWGMVNRHGNPVIACEYDGIEFLENTGNQIVRVYVQEPKYGLVDTLGQLRVDAVYEELGSFSEGRLAVKRNGLWGFVDAEGLEVIPCRFREVLNFSEGLAAVKVGRQWGFIDKQGDAVIEFKYTKAGNFKAGLAWASTVEGTGYLNQQEQFVIPPKFEKAFDFTGEVARVVVEGKYGLIDRQGNFVTKPRYTSIEAFNRHGLAIVGYSKDWLRYGVINQRGDLITNQSYNEIQPFSEGLAVVKIKERYGFVDTTGKLVISANYSKASSFHEGRAMAQKDNTCGYLSRTGEAVIPFQFSKCLDFQDGKAVVYKGIRRAGLVDTQGNLIIEPSVDRLLQFREGRGLVRDNEYRFYYITEQANLYNGFYEKATEFKHGVAVVQMNGKWGIINRKGIEIIPPKYDKIDGFENGYAKVRIEGFTGLSNLKGELIIEPDYEYISYAGDGLFRVEQGDKIGYFDQSGDWVWTLSK
jgi:hypothetical protein